MSDGTDKLMLSEAALRYFHSKFPGTPIAVKCFACKSDNWNLFYDQGSGKLMAACARCERPVELAVYLKP